MPAPTLLAIATRACIRNLSNISDLGDLQYDLVRPILRKIHNPQQLEELEKRSPHIADADGELWQTFLLRDTRTWAADRVEPSNPRSWHKLYKKICRKERKETEAREKELKAKIMTMNEERESNRAEFIQQLKPPPTEAGKQRLLNGGQLNPNYRGFGSRPALPADPAARARQKMLNAIRKPSAVRPPMGTTLKQQEAEREALRLKARNQIREAPRAMVRDKQRSAQNAASMQAQLLGGTRLGTDSPTRGSSSHSQTPQEDVQRTREERLRKLTTPNPPTTTRRPQMVASNADPQAIAASALRSPSNATAIVSPPTLAASPRPLKRPGATTSVLLPPKKRKL